MYKSHKITLHKDKMVDTDMMGKETKIHLENLLGGEYEMGVVIDVENIDYIEVAGVKYK